MSERWSTGCARHLLRRAVAEGPVGHADLGERVLARAARRRRAASILARPKSRTLAWPPGVTITLLGLRSRWTMPAAWATARASAIWMAMERALQGSSGRPPISCLERGPLDVLHDDVVEAVGLAHVEDGRDVGVVEGRAEAGLALEAAAGRLAVGQLRAEDLDDHRAVQAQVLRLVGGGLAALAQLLDDAVMGEDPAGFEVCHAFRRPRGRGVAADRSVTLPSATASIAARPTIRG